MNVSVVIPAFNAERYLRGAIESVLRQTQLPARIVVVDDGSTDGTARVTARFGGAVRCVSQPNAGVAAARNRGARETDTPWLAFLDADDEWLPTKLERQDAALRAGGTVCFTGLRVIHEASGIVSEMGVGDVDTDLSVMLFHQKSIPPGTSSTMVVRRDLFEQIGGYDERLSTAADWDMLIRLRMATAFRYVPEALVLYRRHSTNMSRSAEALEHDSKILLAKAFSSSGLPEALRRMRRRCLAWNDLVLAGSYSRAGRWDRAFGLAFDAIRQDPWLAPRALGFPARHLRRLLTRRPALETL